MVTREFSGKREEEVITLALETLKLREDQVKIEFVEQKGRIFPFAKKNVTAQVSYSEELQFGNRCLMLVRDLLEKMSIEAKIYLLEETDEKVVIKIESPDFAIIIGKKGRTLESIQTLINVIMNKNSNLWIKIIIDIGNYRNRQERYLNKIALHYANIVRKTKKSFLLEPMNPFERRIIHMVLKDENNIDTQSEGEGTIKKIRILFKEDKT